MLHCGIQYHHSEQPHRLDLFFTRKGMNFTERKTDPKFEGRQSGTVTETVNNFVFVISIVLFPVLWARTHFHQASMQ